jgi:uncharacterized protein (DUF2147 family)
MAEDGRWGDRDPLVRGDVLRPNRRYHQGAWRTDAEGLSGSLAMRLDHITNQRPTGDGKWLGQVTDPRDGKTYQAEICVDDEGRLNLRGFIGIPLFGRTEIWHPFTGRLGADCAVVG